jgi:5'-3' exonuclease
MGIKDYHKWMREAHPHAFKTAWLDTYDNIYIDINFALHYSHFGAKNENEIVGKLIWFIDTIITKFFPTRSIIIANDGPAPLAKLLLQRERRSGSCRKISDLKTSSLIFTPGTYFMNSIQSKLETYMNQIKKKYKVQVKYLIGCEGEAELKLKKQLTENIKKYSNDTHIIISNDADMIAMFGTLDVKSFFKVFICSNVGTNSKKDTEIISIGTLMDSHTNKYGMTKNFGLDFTLLSIMLGNDYLPKIQYVELDKLLSSYKKAIFNNQNGLVLNINLEINIKLFVNILNGVIANTRMQYIDNFHMHNLNFSLYSNYMDGLLWCLDMYYQGECTRYNYMYENDENPHPFGLIFYMNLNPEICDLNTQTYPSMDSNLYSILVMPKKALSLIDSKYHSFSENSYCDILYEKELCLTCNDYYKKIDNANSNIAQKNLERELDEHTDTECEVSCETCSDFHQKINDVKNNIKQEQKKIKKELKGHEDTHPRIIVNDIMDIVNQYNLIHT